LPCCLPDLLERHSPGVCRLRPLAGGGQLGGLLFGHIVEIFDLKFDLSLAAEREQSTEFIRGRIIHDQAIGVFDLRGYGFILDFSAPVFGQFSFIEKISYLSPIGQNDNVCSNKRIPVTVLFNTP
jgi:hypothetical protein